jgi:hypothetical protein
MKIRSLLLGSVAAAGLSTGAYAADLGVLTAVNVCDELGLSGLIIASDTNCLQISGEVKYEFQWGDYEEEGLGEANNNGWDPDGIILIDTEAGDYKVPDGDESLDWKSRVDAFIRFVATANSDFGPARAVIKIKETQLVNGFGTDLDGGPDGGQGAAETVIYGDSDTAFDDGYYFDEAYVAIGDSTVIMAGKKASLLVGGLADDVPLNFLGLFNSEDVDVGVKWGESIPDAGHVIQVTSDLGNGVSVGVGLENINDISTMTSGSGSTDTAVYKAGTLVGVLAYAGDGLSAHVTGVAGGVLDGVIERWGVHAGVSGTFDPIKFVAAIAAGNNLETNDEPPGDLWSDGVYWNALASVSATFDMFTIAVSGEAATDRETGAGPDAGALTGDIDYGGGGSISVAATDMITINLGGRWYYDAFEDANAWQAEAQLVAALTETLTLTGGVGAFDTDHDYDSDDWEGPVYYGSATVGWAPGGNFTSSLKGEAYSNGAWRTTFKAAKTFE